MNFNQLVLILWARKWILFVTLFIVSSTTLVVSFLLPPKYTATVSIVVDTKSTDPITGMPVSSSSQLMMSGYMATQVDVISSHANGLRVVDKLKMTSIPAIQESFLKATKGNGEIRDWLADFLLTDLDVKPSRESSVIVLSYSNQDPKFAATLANTFAESYIEISLELKVDPAKRQNEWFDEQIQGLRKNLADSQQKLSIAQREHRIVATDNNRLDLESTRLAEISSQLSVAQAQANDSQNRLRQMNEATTKGHLQELPELLSNGLLQNMKVEIARSEAKLAELSKRFGKNHPQYQGTLAELNSLKDKVELEIANTKGSIKQVAEIDQHRETALQQALENQKQHIFDLKQQRDELDVLINEVANAQHAYDIALQRAGQVHLESQIDQSNIAILNPAIAPLKPTSPKKLLNFILSIFLGTLLGTGFALMAEMVDRRLRTAADIEEGLEMVLLAEIPEEIKKVKKSLRLRLFGVRRSSSNLA